MEIELRQIAPHDPVALELAEALRDEVEARQATTAPRGRQRAATEIKDFEFVRPDTHER